MRAGIKLNPTGTLHNKGHQSAAKQVYEQLKTRNKLDGNAPHAWAPKPPKRRTFHGSSSGATKLSRKAQCERDNDKGGE